MLSYTQIDKCMHMLYKVSKGSITTKLLIVVFQNVN